MVQALYTVYGVLGTENWMLPGHLAVLFPVFLDELFQV